MRACSETGCTKPHKARGLCIMHYRRATRPRPSRDMQARHKSCSRPSCLGRVHAKGVCVRHYHENRYAVDRDNLCAQGMSRALRLAPLDLDQRNKSHREILRGVCPRGDFSGADLKGCRLDGHFKRATFVAVLAAGTTFVGCFRDADFVGANLTDADFTGADLRDAVFSSCTLKNTRFPADPKMRGSVKLIQCEGEPIC